MTKEQIAALSTEKLWAIYNGSIGNDPKYVLTFCHARDELKRRYAERGIRLAGL